MRVRAAIDPVRFTEIMYLAKTIWAEARGEGPDGMRLVAWVIRARVESPKWPDTYASVVTQRNQFSAWLHGDPNRDKMVDPLAGPDADDAMWYEAIRIADEVLDAPASDNPLPGVYHYVDVRLEGRLPSWAQGMEQIRRPEAPRIIFLRG